MQIILKKCLKRPVVHIIITEKSKYAKFEIKKDKKNMSVKVFSAQEVKIIIHVTAE